MLRFVAVVGQRNQPRWLHLRRIQKLGLAAVHHQQQPDATTVSSLPPTIPSSPPMASTHVLQEFSSLDQMKFDDKFNATSCSDFHDVKEGGYVDLDPKDVAKTIPEGLAGEMNDEFDFSSRTSWMVRDTAKLLIRILEEYETTKKAMKNDKLPRSFSSRIQLHGLTDRPEWSDAKMQLHYYGTELQCSARTSSSSSSGSSRSNGTEPSHNDSELVGGSNSNSSEDMVVVRGEGSVVESYMQSLLKDGRKLPTKIVLTGPRGVGKSASLNQLVYHARKRGWLCLFVPRGWDQVQSGWYIEPVQGGGSSSNNSDENETDIKDDMSKSTTTSIPHENALYDNPFMSAEVLRGFWRAHKDQLKTIPISRVNDQTKYQSYIEKFRENWNRARSMPGREKLSFLKLREIVEAEDSFADQDEMDADVLKDYEFDATFAPKTLEDLVRMGVAFRDLSGQIVMDVVAELRALDIPDMPVLVAVDQFNTWEGPSVYHYKNNPVKGFDLCVPRALHFVSKKKSETERWVMANGLCVAATSMRHPEGRKERYEDHKSSVPLVVRVPCYSQVECLAAVSYYTHQKRIGEGVSIPELLTFRTLAGSNPRDIRKESVPFFFPLAVARHGMDFMKPLAEDNDNETDNQDGDELSDAEMSDPDLVKDTELADIVDAVAGPGPGVGNAAGGTTSSPKHPAGIKRNGNTRR